MCSNGGKHIGGDIIHDSNETVYIQDHVKSVFLCRSVYSAAVWYYNHLAGLINVVMITEDQDAVTQYGNLTAGVYVITVQARIRLLYRFIRISRPECRMCCCCRISCGTFGRSCGQLTTCTAPFLRPCKERLATTRRESTPSIGTPKSWRRESSLDGTFRYGADGKPGSQSSADERKILCEYIRRVSPF